MNLLVTAGNTQTPIDRVRCITNIFTGRTGAAIALEAYGRGHDVTLLTSHPEAVAEMVKPPTLLDDVRWHVHLYRTFNDLRDLMARLITDRLDGVIHCAAVNDYELGGVFAPVDGTRFDPGTGTWHGQPARLGDRAAGKIKSDQAELWLRLVRAPKLVDMIRGDWGFRGVLVKFKLEVGISDDELLSIAEASRLHSGADLMAANTLEGATAWAYIGPTANGYERIARRVLAERVLGAVEAKYAELRHG